MQIICIGGGGQFTDIASFFFNDNLCVIDDNKIGAIHGFPVIGSIDDFLNKRARFNYKQEYMIFNAIGSTGTDGNKTRNEIYERFVKAGYKITPLVFPSDIAVDVRIGENVCISLNCELHHGVRLGHHVVLAPRTLLCGGVTVKDNAYIGAGAILKQGITVGENAVIGMGSIVLNDIPDNCTAVGNPARIIRSG